MHKRNANVYIGRSSIAGRGIFAAHNFKKGEYVAPLVGTAHYRNYEKPSEWKNESTWIPVAIHRWVNPEFPMRFINHSCDPTVGFKTPRRAYALRNIKKGEEITVDYSTIEYVTTWKFPCSCKSKKCRKTLRSVQFLSPKLYRSYLPYIPRFIQKAYRQRERTVR